MTTQPLDLEPCRRRAADARSAVDQIRHAGPADLVAHGLKAAMSAADVPGLIAELVTVTEQRDGHYAQFFDTQRELAAALTEVEQLRRERDTLREVARSNKRHVATLSVLLERVEKLTVSTDGDDLDPDVEIPVGEIRRAIQEPIPGEAGAR